LSNFDVIVVGGGAAGFFGAIACTAANPRLSIALIEKSGNFLSKVRVSGGGRCNVTHACFDPARLVQAYPRGSRELRSAFARFQPADTVNWFQSRNVSLKTESDGRMFPVTDDSGTIIECLMQEAEKQSIHLFNRTGVRGIRLLQNEARRFELLMNDENTWRCDKLLLATGGFPREDSYRFISELGHTIIPPAPSLFTFNIQEQALHQLAGISVPHAVVKIPGTKLVQEGPLLITHWGMSGPAVLKLSAWGARILQEKNYEFQLMVNWTGKMDEDDTRDYLQQVKGLHAKKQIALLPLFELPKRLWQFLVLRSGIDEQQRWADVPKKNLGQLLENIIRGVYQVKGKSTFKEEFVTCGGVALSGVDFKTMESRLCEGLHFAGEILDIDGVTGGFNFQAAWTTGYIAGNSMGKQE
jgi:predicted Rossmann fold flavoprotein